MFDAMIRDAAERFGLGERARGLLGALLSIVFDERNGGIAGLLAKFRRHGAGDLFTSWIGNAQPKPIEPRQLENVLGPEAISELARRLGAARGPTLDAAVAMLPKLIGTLTQNGQLPTRAPRTVGEYMTDFNRFGEWTMAAQRAAGAEAHVSLAPGLGWVKWALLLAVILALGHCVLYRAPEALAPALSGRAVSVQGVPAPTAEPTLSLSSDGGAIRYWGRLGSAGAPTRLADAGGDAAGAGRASGSVTIDADTKPAAWLDSLIALLPELLKASGAKLEIEGNVITLDGPLAQEQRRVLDGLLRNLFDSHFVVVPQQAGGGAAQDASGSLVPSAGGYVTKELDDDGRARHRGVYSGAG
jgi:uncharacterized protein YidB (DUF937 family)